jgi:hypothetical protein
MSASSQHTQNQTDSLSLRGELDGNDNTQAREKGNTPPTAELETYQPALLPLTVVWAPPEGSPDSCASHTSRTGKVRQSTKGVGKPTKCTPEEEHQRRALFAQLVALFLGDHPDPEDVALERPKYNRAIKRLMKKRLQPPDLEALKTAYEQRWPGIDCTALGIANNLVALIKYARGMGYSIGARDAAVPPPGELAQDGVNRETQAEEDEATSSPEAEGVVDPEWVAQLSRFVPDAEGGRAGRSTRDVQMLWGFVRDALRPGLNTARRQHLDSLVPAWNPANPRELLLLGATSYTIRFANMAMLRDIDAFIGKLLNRFFDHAQLVLVRQEVIEHVQEQRQDG